MKHSTRLDERGELPRCAACGKITGDAGVHERDPDDGVLSFCDGECREIYLTRMDIARDESEPGDLAA